MRRPALFFFFFLFSSLMAEDSIENFFENRFSLQPPTEEDELAVVQAVKDFLDKIKAGDISGAYFLTTSPQFQLATPLENFRIFVQSFHDIDLKEKFNIHNVIFTDANKTKAAFAVMLKGKKKGQRFNLEFALENQDGDWKIMSVKVYEITSP